MKKLSIFLILSIFVLISLTASGGKDKKSIKIAFLPVVDSLPAYIAQEEGLFEKQGITVEAIAVNSPVERDQLMQAGEITGMLNELSTTALFNRNTVQLQTVQIVRMASENSPVFRILASPSSGIISVKDLAGVEIGVSKNSVIEYLTDRILMKEGLPPDEINVKSVPVIPERFQLLMSGQIGAATLPDPLAQAAVAAGAVEVIDDRAYPEYSNSVLSFDVKIIEENPDSLIKFMKAWNEAVELLNKNPEKYRGLLLEKIRVPQSVGESFIIPPFASPQLPTEEQWNDVLDWLGEKELMTSRPSYSESVNEL